MSIRTVDNAVLGWLQCRSTEMGGHDPPGRPARDNINWEKPLNTTRVSWPISDTKPKDEELFGKEVLEEE